jgi:type I restriction enzyme M protein
VAAVSQPARQRRGEQDAGQYADVAGFSASATIEQIGEHRYVLPPSRYVGAEADEDDGEPLDEKIARLTEQLFERFEESSLLQERVREALRRLNG